MEIYLKHKPTSWKSSGIVESSFQEENLFSKYIFFLLIHILDLVSKTNIYVINLTLCPGQNNESNVESLFLNLSKDRIRFFFLNSWGL